jgi:hypothetical protein
VTNIPHISLPFGMHRPYQDEPEWQVSGGLEGGVTNDPIRVNDFDQARAVATALNEAYRAGYLKALHDSSEGNVSSGGK